MLTKLKPFPRKIACKIFDFLLPARCLSCTKLIEEPHALCSECWKNLNFITTPFCRGCGFPFEVEIGEQALCGRCIQAPASYTHARAALCYDDACKPLILRFKHSDAIHLAPLMSKWMLRAGKDLIDQADYMVPVPLHWQRMFVRRYNQAALLTLELSKLTKKSTAVDMLKRHRSTPPQGSKRAGSRQQNVAGAFVINPSWYPKIRGKTILLIDDVMTSGATLQSCTAPLLKAGAKRVDVLTIAKVI